MFKKEKSYLAWYHPTTNSQGWCRPQNQITLKELEFPN